MDGKKLNTCCPKNLQKRKLLRIQRSSRLNLLGMNLLNKTCNKRAAFPWGSLFRSFFYQKCSFHNNCKCLKISIRTRNYFFNCWVIKIFNFNFFCDIFNLKIFSTSNKFKFNSSMDEIIEYCNKQSDLIISMAQPSFVLHIKTHPIPAHKLKIVLLQPPKRFLKFPDNKFGNKFCLRSQRAWRRSISKKSFRAAIFIFAVSVEELEFHFSYRRDGFSPASSWNFHLSSTWWFMALHCQRSSENHPWRNRGTFPSAIRALILKHWSTKWIN